MRWPTGTPLREPPLEYLEAIFGRREMPPDAGLYMVAGLRRKVDAGPQVMFAPLLRGDAMYAGLFTFYGHRFMLSFIGEPVPSDISWQLFDDWHGAHIARRMTTFQVEIAGRLSHRLKFAWGSRQPQRA